MLTFFVLNLSFNILNGIARLNLYKERHILKSCIYKKQLVNI